MTHSSPDIAALADRIADHVSTLANTKMQMSLVIWDRMSRDFLEAVKLLHAAAQAAVDQQLEEAGKAVIAIRNELDRVRVDRDYQADLAERWKAQFDSAAAAASEYSEFWEKHQGDFDQFGNYIPHSQMDGDLRAAKAEIELLRTQPQPAPDDSGVTASGFLHNLVDWVYLHATEGQTWPSTRTAQKLIGLARTKPATQTEADAMKAAAPAAPQAAPWQPIDTAPKDGTKIDVWLECRSNRVASYRKPSAWWDDQRQNWLWDGQWSWRIGPDWIVTHWMPLPSSPLSRPDRICPDCGRPIDGPTHAAYCAVPSQDRGAQ